MTIPTASAGLKRGVELCFSAWKSNSSLGFGSTKSCNSNLNSSVNTSLKLPSSLKSSNTTSSSSQSPDTNQNFLSTIANIMPAVLDMAVGLLGMAGLFLLGGHLGALVKFKKSD